MQLSPVKHWPRICSVLDLQVNILLTSTIESRIDRLGAERSLFSFLQLLWPSVSLFIQGSQSSFFLSFSYFALCVAVNSQIPLVQCHPARLFHQSDVLYPPSFSVLTPHPRLHPQPPTFPTFPSPPVPELHLLIPASPLHLLRIPQEVVVQATVVKALTDLPCRPPL